MFINILKMYAIKISFAYISLTMKNKSLKKNYFKKNIF